MMFWIVLIVLMLIVGMTVYACRNSDGQVPNDHTSR